MLSAVSKIDSRPAPERDGDIKGQGSFFLDAHVHLHWQYDVGDFLEGACLRFREARGRLGELHLSLGVLALVDPNGQDSFERVREWLAQATGRWTVRETLEAASLILFDEATDVELVLLAGRQIATVEGLEVLAVGSREEQREERSLRDTLDSVQAAGAITILSWGFGKWWFRRGRMVEDVLRSADPEALFLGDNSGRLRYGQPPKAFRIAAVRGIRILPGSDPLPRPDDARRAGSYGAIIEGDLDRSRPAAGLKKLLSENPNQPRVCGSLRPLWPFLSDQLLMQLRKRVSGRR